MDAGRWSGPPARLRLGQSLPQSGAISMSTPALIFVGLIVVLLAVPLAFSLGPLLIGGFLLVLGYRRATDALAAGSETNATFA
jgi:hypothetical protein